MTKLTFLYRGLYRYGIGGWCSSSSNAPPRWANTASAQVIWSALLLTYSDISLACSFCDRLLTSDYIGTHLHSMPQNTCLHILIIISYLPPGKLYAQCRFTPPSTLFAAYSLAASKIYQLPVIAENVCSFTKHHDISLVLESRSRCM